MLGQKVCSIVNVSTIVQSTTFVRNVQQKRIRIFETDHQRRDSLTVLVDDQQGRNHTPKNVGLYIIMSINSGLQ